MGEEEMEKQSIWRRFGMKLICDVELGDKLTIREMAEDGPVERRCTVIRQYPNFILADFGPYKESILKAKIRCKDIEIFKGWKGEII